MPYSDVFEKGNFYHPTRLEVVPLHQSENFVFKRTHGVCDILS